MNLIDTGHPSDSMFRWLLMQLDVERFESLL
jgi:hypothetical protein